MRLNLQRTTQTGDINLTASNITSENVTVNLNGENSELNLISKYDSIKTETQHTSIEADLGMVALVAGLSAGLSAGSNYLGETGYLGSWVQSNMHTFYLLVQLNH